MLAFSSTALALNRDEGRMKSDNKTKPSKLSVAAIIEGLTDQTRRADAKALAKLMQRATGETPKMWGPSIIGFGSYHYTYDSGREWRHADCGFFTAKDRNRFLYH